ncbi:MAG: hypothetical protein RRA15_13370 [bacterium]|nr:hypothetical protein [bacterium]MDT8367450.1 hypothetical protein [bacterium]
MADETDFHPDSQTFGVAMKKYPKKINKLIRELKMGGFIGVKG